MVLSFKEQFKEPILNGTKIHTIRTDQYDRWGVDATAHMATGVRTPKYHCFKQARCTGKQALTLIYDVNGFRALVDGIQLTPGRLLLLANNDGFEDTERLFLWFKSDILNSPKLMINRKIIHWTDYRY